MKKLAAVIGTLILMGGCTTNGVYDSTKTWTLVGAVAIGAAVAASQADDTHSHESNCYFVVKPGSSYEVCK